MDTSKSIYHDLCYTIHSETTKITFHMYQFLNSVIYAPFYVLLAVNVIFFIYLSIFLVQHLLTISKLNFSLTTAHYYPGDALYPWRTCLTPWLERLRKWIVNRSRRRPGTNKTKWTPTNPRSRSTSRQEVSDRLLFVVIIISLEGGFNHWSVKVGSRFIWTNELIFPSPIVFQWDSVWLKEYQHHSGR